MNRGLRRSAVMVFGLIVLFQFNNCGVYESADPVASEESSLKCESNKDCVTETNANLKIQPLPVDNFPVTASLAAFNIGGDCNEAGYTNHRITWVLKRNNTAVRNSNMIINGSSRNSTCVNGKFRIYVSLASISQDSVNRTGLLYGSGTARSAYDLEVEIYAYDKSGAEVRNRNMGSLKQVHLVPVN